jgi:hypothetical protein
MGIRRYWSQYGLFKITCNPSNFLERRVENPWYFLAFYTSFKLFYEGKMSFIDLAGSERGADVVDTNKQTRYSS